MKLYFTRREVARIVGVSPDTLKTWERYLPLKLRTRGGRKLYTRRDLDLVLQARRIMTEQQVPLREVAAYLASQTTKQAPEPFREEIHEGLVELLQRIRHLRERIQQVLEKGEHSE